jgi:hypothetical protein
MGVHLDGSSGIEGVVALDWIEWAPATPINATITAITLTLLSTG